MIENSVHIIRSRRVEAADGQQGCAVVLFSDDSIKCEFKNGKGKKKFYIPYEVLENEVRLLKK